MNAYKKLARHLDNLPGGFLFTQNGVDLRILRWRHTGFNVHTEVRATSRENAERPPPSQVVQQELLMAAEEIGECFRN